MVIIKLPLADLEMNVGQIPGLPMNPRQWTRSEVDSLARSIKETPELYEARALLVFPYQGKYVILGGNLRYEASKVLKLKEVPVIVFPAATPVSKLKEIVIKDNGSFGDWDYDALGNLWDDLPLADWGVPAWETQPEKETTDAQEDDFDENEQEIQARCKLGDIWILGEHRLMCGDSTDPKAVKTLLGGANVDMCLTDPPYGINLNGDNSKRGKGTSLINGGYKLKSFIDDSNIYAIKAFEIVQGLGIPKQVWFGANYYCHALPESNNWLIWDKRVDEKETDTNSDCELAWVKDGHNSCRIFRHLWKGLIKESEKNEKRVHPTQKPIALMAHCIEKYAPEAVNIIDLFGGSGTTLIAAEQKNLVCYMMELEPHYCDVIIARWEKFTGKKAEKV